jgi:hypothetical protein
MFGVRIVAFACTLFGVAVTLPLDLAKARPHPVTKGSYSHYPRKSDAHHTRKSYAAAPHRARKAYARSSSRKTTAGLRVKASASASVGLGARPARWCGWWMRTQKGGGPELNLARNWAHWGRPSGPQVGAVVVWPHHVGMITGRTATGQWIVKSGNDGGQVRERPRSVAGAVFRVGARA